MITNILVNVNRPTCRFTERFVLPQFRDGMKRLERIAMKKEYELGAPIMFSLDDKLWCNDDPIFTLERMLYDTPLFDDAKLLQLTDEYLYAKYKRKGDTKTLMLEDGTIMFTADDSDLSNLKLLNVETDEFIDEEE